jgi:DNA (cytosine-5)-methyltransferase 1
VGGLRYLSVCSGIEAATVAWHPLGWRAAAYSEIEAFPRAVLRHHYPDTPLHGDFTTIEGDEYGPIDLLVGGTPCQSFSVAGLRKGLADERGNLALEYLRLADRTRARWLVWENVPGVLSSEDGRDFGAFLGGLAELGYGFAYRVLDAQFFGLAQRRKRVFVVGHSRDWRAPAAILFERHSLSWDTPPRRETGEESAASTGFSVAGSVTHGYGSKLGTDESCQGSVIAFGWQNSPAQGDSVSDHISPTLDKSKTPAVAIGFGSKEFAQDAAIELAPTLRSVGGYGANGGGPPAVAFAENQRGEIYTSDVTNALARQGGKPDQGYAATLQGSSVRKLTPRECERLQGFPDDYTLVPYRGKPAADGPRYKALGNSMAVPVMRWIGERIAKVESLAILESERAA